MDKTILIVDDEEEICRTLDRILARAGYKTFTAASAMEGLVLLQDNRVHLLITDIRMPGVSGLDLIKQARDLDPRIPVIAISGYGDVATAIESLDRGAFFFLSKPFDAETILGVVDKGMRLPHLVEESAPGVEGAASSIDFKLLPKMEDVPAAGRLVADVARSMGYPSRYYTTILPFVFDEMMVKAVAAGIERGSGEPILARVVIGEEDTRMSFAAPPGTYDAWAAAREMEDADLGDPEMVTMMTIGYYADSFTVEEDGGGAAEVVIVNRKEPGAAGKGAGSSS
ncbi:MAG: sigma-54-dependent transcriptional regulator [Candidatus Nitrospinota bacterium M3_3B_026]